MTVPRSPETGCMQGDVALDTAAVLILDCQTSGAHAQNGHIIEVGWIQSNTGRGKGRRGSIETCFVQLPEGAEIPKRVQQVTGINQHDLDEGITARAAWKKIAGAARDVARLNRTETCPAIVHFSRFEEPFLRELHQRYTRKKPFPLELICTHEISRRLFPALPRRGIRALAGFFGHGIHGRRCRDHVIATELIWQELIALLQKKHNVHTLAQLQHWLDTAPIHVHVYRSYPMERQKRRYLPDRSGVYRMLRSNGDVLYVGKAGSLRKRVNSYFTRRSQHADHILEMLSQAKMIDITETASALEAAILESDEIKQHAPPYNRALQAGGRTVWFCTPDLREFGHTPSHRLTRGPFAQRTSITSLAAIQEVMKSWGGSWNDETALEALALPAEYAPGNACIRAGCGLFFQQNADAFKAAGVERALASLGKKFWLQHKAEPGADDDNDDDLQSHTRPRERTPDMVARIITANVRAGTRALRRAPWMVWLTESTIAWEEVRNSKKQRYLLVFESGEIVHRQQISRTQDIPVPPGYLKKYRARQHSFDLETYDRMRVLQAEIRTILSSGRWLAVRLGPTILLERSTLDRILKWI